MKKIELKGNRGKGMFALVDEDDYERVNQLKWYPDKGNLTKYAGTFTFINGKPVHVALHRLIMGLSKGDGKEIDHINGNGLDNRKQNLRVCTRGENLRNSKFRKGSSSHRGVHLHKGSKKWYAQIRFDNKKHYLGSFDCEIEAAEAYNNAAKEHHGEFATLNEI